VQIKDRNGKKFAKECNVTVAANVPALTGTVSISGTAQVGQTLTANTSSLGGRGTISYQWLRNGTDNIGTDSNTYTLVDADAGSKISVQVSRAKNTGTVTSDPTAEVITTGGISIGNGVSGDDFPGDANVSATGTGNLAISNGDSSTIGVTDTPPTAVDWQEDGTVVSAFKDKASETFNAAYVKSNDNDLTIGVHTVRVTVTIAGVRYSKTVTLTVTE
jgi:hypothetical protein